MCTRLMHTPKMGGGTRAKGTLFGNDFFLDVIGGSVATNKGSIDLSNSSTYTAINGADVDYLSATYSTYGSQLNSLRLKNAQDVIALKPVAGSVIYVFGQGNNKTGAEARIPKFATDAALSSALNETPGADHPASGTYVYKFEVPEDFDGEKPLYIGSYNGDAFFSYIIVELPQVESLYEVTVSASPVEGGLVSAVQEPQQDGVTEVVTLYATPKKGYVFEEWQDAEGNTLSTTTPYTDSIKADAAYVAVFESTALPVSATPATVLVKHVYDVTGCKTKGDNQLIDSSHDGDYIKFDVIPAVAGKYSFTSMIGTKNDGMGVTLGYVDAGGNYVESEKKDITNSGNWNSGENYTWEFDLEESGKLYTFKMLCHAKDSYCVSVFEMDVVRIGDATPTYTVTYGLGETGAVGAAPAAESLKSGKSITIPTNYTLYKEGYTLTGWTDGETTYKVGDKMTVTSNVSLTPVFTQNNVSLATRNDAVTITWDFQRKNGAPTVAWEKRGLDNMSWVSQVKVNGETIDVRMRVNVAAGKFNNVSKEDLVQINGGTILSIPACKGAIIRWESSYATKITTIAGDTIDQETTTPTYTYEGSDEQIDIVIGDNDGKYWRTVTLTLPARTLEVVDREDLVAEGTYAQATYSRTVDPAYNYGTICLPFTPDAETCEQYTFYTLSAATNNTITFVEVAEPQANMPYLYSAKDREATTHTFTGGETTVNTEAGAQVVGNWSFAGVFAKTVFKPAELNANLYIYKPTSGEDLIVEALNSLTMWPYRAYFKCNQVVAASAPTLRVVIDGGVTGIEEVITPDQIEGAVIYDLMGRPVQQMIEGNFYIVNGEKVLY